MSIAMKKIIITIFYSGMSLLVFSQQKLSYKGGDTAFIRFLKSSFNQDSAYGQSRYVNVFFNITKDGKISNISTLNSENDPIYIEIIRILNDSKGSWKRVKISPKPILLIIGFLNSLEEKSEKSKLTEPFQILNRTAYFKNTRTNQIDNYIVIGPIIFEWMF